jgi:beta-phosphoglucomutase
MHSQRAVLFDLDGVLTETADLHYRSWCQLADETGLEIDRGQRHNLRGRTRIESLRLLLGDRFDALSPVEHQRLTERKNALYLKMVDQLTAADLLPGVADLLAELRQRGVRLAVASSSRNAAIVVEKLGVGDAFDAIVDANEAPRSKPDPQVFLLAAERVGVPPASCVVIEDAAAGIEAARAAGMPVVGVGPAARVGAADIVVGRLSELACDDLLRLRRG